MLTPVNCYFVHQSKHYAEEEGLRTEPIYGTQFKADRIPDALM